MPGLAPCCLIWGALGVFRYILKVSAKIFVTFLIPDALMDENQRKEAGR